MLQRGEELVRDLPRYVPHDYVESVKEFFDRQYQLHFRYWWGGANRYSLDPLRHTPFHAFVLRQALRRGPGRLLDVGAGEGADAIRMAKLGYQVDAIDVSSVACEKMARFAREERVYVNVIDESILTLALDSGAYDIVLMNGSLHYIADKRGLLEKLREASAPEALHAVSLFSNTTSLSPEHSAIPVFPDDEKGLVEGFYRNDRMVRADYVKNKQEESHPGFPDHTHSFIKLIVTLSEC
jgi:SAM-dependent methyltransferase